MKIIYLDKIQLTASTHNPKIKKREMLKKGNIPHLETYSSSLLKPGQISSEHSHKDNYEIFFIYEGKGIVKINGKVQAIAGKMCIVIEPGEVHEILNTGSQDLIYTYFRIEN